MNPSLTAEIQAEQNHGRQKYGSGPDDLAHDDRQPESIWHDRIQDHNQRAREGTPMERRQHLVKIAGLAVSAIEAFDRKTAKPTEYKDPMIRAFAEGFKKLERPASPKTEPPAIEI